MKTNCVPSRSDVRGRFARRTIAIAVFCVVWFALGAASLCFSEDDKVESETSAEESSKGDPSWLKSETNSSLEGLEFRIDNSSRFIRRERETEYKSSTIFYDDLVFDFVGDNGEIVIYSFSSRRFALIDPIRRSRAEIDEAEIDRFLQRVKPILRDKNDGFTKFMTEPSFEVSEKEDELFFQSKWIDYRATTRAFDDKNVADAYFQFINALGKLNVYMNPGVVTPLARMEINRKLEEEQRFPEKIVTEIYPKGKSIFARIATIENEASLARRLSERDRDRINRALHFVEQFPFISFREYFDQTSKK